VHPVRWSADGRLLYFRHRAEVSTLDMQTGQERVVEGVSGRFGLSPDGRAWAWIDGPLPVHNGQPADSDAQNRSNFVSLKVMPVEGGTPHRIDLGGGVPTIPANDADHNKSIRIHPDGRRIAIETTEPKAEVWMMASERNDRRRCH
jgi:Tol biopolymer transport system component